ncbi:unnamed protein product [Spodoptera littoralis]|uniref:Uncharacterized protein n=1 Tax=Spodoptera littoralis TaxID=7109 RepID=A0A9P0N0M8_SPOLI|nr:unnamed protein product [Spodoptera littoralis]CAH1637145.1 unnamed protein product [Spodoptera littoralis]
MSHFGDFMDGVPVKISEKYKRPLRFDLPYTVNECPIRAQAVVDSANYSCAFERNVLAKLKELRNAKETKKNERRHRLQLLQEAEQKRLDAIAAAEDEERLKQLSVSEVSYPSTDEISPLSPDEKADKNCDNIAKLDKPLEHTDVSTSIDYPTTSAAVESQLNILQPIQVKTHLQENSLLDDPDPLQNLKLNTKITKIPHNPNIDTLTFRDFENDTSSPFDNVELKTINDMELLAQVLQSQKDSTTSCQPQPSYGPEHSYTIPNCASQPHVEGVTYLPAQYLDQPIQNSNIMYGSPQHYPMSNGYYIPTDNEAANMYMHNYQYYVPPNPYTPVEPYYGSQMPTTSADIGHVPNGSYIPQPYYYHQYPQVPVAYPPGNAPEAYPVVLPNESSDQTTAATGPQAAVKSRSRSVPDIVKELNEELAKLRMSERSYNASPAPKNQSPQTSTPAPATSSDSKVEKRSRKRTENLPNPFEKLSPKLQDMCRKIHGMGFPLDRVARVCTLVGDNDKKVIEGLLILGDLMDLGFPEGRVSAALAKHEFNRDKALDELVP